MWHTVALPGCSWSWWSRRELRDVRINIPYLHPGFYRALSLGFWYMVFDGRQIWMPFDISIYIYIYIYIYIFLQPSRTQNQMWVGMVGEVWWVDYFGLWITIFIIDLAAPKRLTTNSWRCLSLRTADIALMRCGEIRVEIFRWTTWVSHSCVLQACQRLGYVAMQSESRHEILAGGPSYIYIYIYIYIHMLFEYVWMMIFDLC